MLQPGPTAWLCLCTAACCMPAHLPGLFLGGLRARRAGERQEGQRACSGEACHCGQSAHRSRSTDLVKRSHQPPPIKLCPELPTTSAPSPCPAVPSLTAAAALQRRPPPATAPRPRPWHRPRSGRWSARRRKRRHGRRPRSALSCPWWTAGSRGRGMRVCAHMCVHGMEGWRGWGLRGLGWGLGVLVDG